MKCIQLIKYLEVWAPKEIAWEKDNVGLQVGSAERQLKNIMLSLDLNRKVIDNAVKKNCNLIITHHPLLFTPLKKIDVQSDEKSKLIEKLIKNDITLYSTHTNLDFTKDGVSFQLAKKLGLSNVDFLKRLPENQLKLAVFVPEENVEDVASAVHSAGGGIIGEYSHCSYRTKGMGTFKGTEKSNPVIGKRNRIEKVDEVRLEILVDNWKLKNVVSAMKQAHPFEEVAYDLYPLKNENVNYGVGAIGNLPLPMNKKGFLDYISKKLKIKDFRYANGKNGKINTVAVCGGSCSELLNLAIHSSADAFVTADIKYHTFQDAEYKILMIDAGHFETEIYSMDEVQKRLKNFLNNSSVNKVFKYKGSTNPVIFYNN